MQEPTRVTSTGGATLIDLALVSNLEAIERCSVIPPLANSDHNGISLTMNLRKPSKPTTKRSIWRYTQADFDKASEMIDTYDWDSLLLGKSVDEACLAWQEKFLSIMEQCIPRGAVSKKCAMGFSTYQTNYSKEKLCLQKIQKNSRQCV